MPSLATSFTQFIHPHSLCMKAYVYSAALSLLGLALTVSTASAQAPVHRTCASVEALQAQLAADPGMAQRMATINSQAVQFAKSNQAANATGAVTLTIRWWCTCSTARRPRTFPTPRFSRRLTC